MRKKGFTLIELLAVIVILAILALILTPMIQDLILSARKAAFERSLEGILSAAEYYQIENPSSGDTIFECNGISCEDSNGNKLLFNGEVPKSGTVSVKGNVAEAKNICNNSFCGSGTKESLLVNAGGESNQSSVAVGTEWMFGYVGNMYDYTGDVQTYVVPKTGTYKLEVWGAQGGSSVGNGTFQKAGGFGAYATGEVALTKDQILYIVVGGKGEDGVDNYNAQGGYNGGGGGSDDRHDDESGGGGGGATHIAINNNLGELKNYIDNKDNVLIVAGGGGGSAWYEAPSAGGYQSYSDSHSATSIATQTEGYAFGQGQSAVITEEATAAADGNGGGGGGWYGGFYQDVDDASCGTGGSSYIGNSLLSNKSMYCYGCSETDEPSIKTVRTVKHSFAPISQFAKSGNGYARITFLNDTLEENYQIQEFNIPKTGTYKLEVWGAQGGASILSGKELEIGGLGGYSVGEVSLTAGTKLYIAVGGKGGIGNLYACSTGGYNGGGIGTNDGGTCSESADDEAAGGGGGATHIAINNNLGELKNYVDNKENILIVAGGGGGGSYSVNGGAGGGETGGLGGATMAATQTEGYAFGQGQDANGGGKSNGLGGGGGGYYGGYQGAGTTTTDLDDASGGGSGFVSPLLTDASTTAGLRLGNGFAKITYVR